MSNETIRIEEYSDKSFAVRGPTKPYKNILKNMGGRWNPNLRGGEGWWFKNEHLDSVTAWLPEVQESKQSYTNIRHRAAIRTLEASLDEVELQIADLKAILRKRDQKGFGWCDMLAIVATLIIVVPYILEKTM
jgi:hypothetical protein